MARVTIHRLEAEWGAALDRLPTAEIDGLFVEAFGKSLQGPLRGKVRSQLFRLPLLEALAARGVCDALQG